MKLAMMFAAGALAFGAVAAEPAQAQGRYDRDRGGWDRGDRWHGGNDRRWHSPRYGYRGDYRGGRRGWNGGGYGRPRVVCRVQRGYYGPVRRCFRVYR